MNIRISTVYLANFQQCVMENDVHIFLHAYYFIKDIIPTVSFVLLQSLYNFCYIAEMQNSRQDIGDNHVNII